MLFKEKLLLSNCDSVKRLPAEQLKKRFLTGMAFGDGVGLSPNMLIDNTGFEALLARRRQAVLNDADRDMTASAS